MVIQMTWDNQGYDSDSRGNDQLPRPRFALKEERKERQGDGDDATHRLGPIAQDIARHEAAYADKQALEGGVTHLKQTREAHRSTTEAADESDANPHIKDYVLIMGSVSCALIVFMVEIHHQGCTNQRDAKPDPLTPFFVPQHEGQEFQQEENGSRIAPREKHIFSRGNRPSVHFAADLVDDI